MALAANDLVGKPDVEVGEAFGDKFPKHIYWETDYWAVDAAGAPSVGERTEVLAREPERSSATQGGAELEAIPRVC